MGAFAAADSLRQEANHRDMRRAVGERPRMRIWEHSDFKEIIDGLKAQGRLRDGRGFYRNKLVLVKNGHIA
jgi:hypothetical protein